MIKSSLPKEAKIDITIDDIRLKSNLSTNKIIRFLKNQFFFTILGFTQSQSGSLGDLDG